MTHDPLCPDQDHPLPRKCVNCSLIRDTREDMLAKCIAAVKEVRNELAHPDWVRLTARDGAQESVNELKRIQRALQEKP